MSEQPREKQIAEAVALVRGLLGERDATKVEVEVTRGGTYRITAEAGGVAVTQAHPWKPR